MSLFNIDYRENTAGIDAVREHLLNCSDNFTPPLLTYIDLEEYVGKLSSMSVNIEAWHDGKLVGLIAAYLNNLEAGHAYITNVSVESAYNGKGIASQLLEKMETASKKAGFAWIALEVKAENTKAARFYKNNGYQVTRQTDYNLFMEKAL